MRLDQRDLRGREVVRIVHSSPGYVVDVEVLVAIVTREAGGVDVVEVVELDGVLVEARSGLPLGVELVALLPLSAVLAAA